MVAIALAAVTITSCTQQTPTAPSALGGSIAAQPAAEYWVTLFDETEPPPPPGEPEPSEPDPSPSAPAPRPPSGSPPSPWPPGPPPKAQPGVPVPTPPSTHQRVRIRINPEPVQASSTRFETSSCRDHEYFWYYDQELITDTGVTVVFDERNNFFDGRFTSKNKTRVSIPGNNSVIVHTRWCSSYAIPHYTQTQWIGKDDYNEEVVISGPWVRLLTP
jgi:hypothetical protein